MKKNKLLFIFIYVAAFILCVLLIYVIPSVEGMLEETYIAENGEIEVSDEIDAYVVRNETVFTAGEACSVNRLVKAKELVRAGTAIVELSGQGKVEMDEAASKIKSNLGKAAVATSNGATSVPGYVSYFADGSEGVLSYKNISKLDEEQFESACSVSTRSTAKGKCAKGEPVFKITANGDWWLVFYTDKDSSSKYEEGDNVRLIVGSENVNAYIDSVTKCKDGKYRIVICCSVFVKNYLKARTMSAKVIIKSASGLVVEKSSIVKKDKTTGVIVKDKNGNNVFVPVNILADDGEKCIVSEDIYMDEESNFVETISVYEEILTSPSQNDIKKAG